MPEVNNPKELRKHSNVMAPRGLTRVRSAVDSEELRAEEREAEKEQEALKTPEPPAPKGLKFLRNTKHTIRSFVFHGQTVVEPTLACEKCGAKISVEDCIEASGWRDLNTRLTDMEEHDKLREKMNELKMRWRENKIDFYNFLVQHTKLIIKFQHREANEGLYPQYEMRVAVNCPTCKILLGHGTFRAGLATDLIELGREEINNEIIWSRIDKIPRHVKAHVANQLRYSNFKKLKSWIDSQTLNTMVKSAKQVMAEYEALEGTDDYAYEFYAQAKSFIEGTPRVRTLRIKRVIDAIEEFAEKQIGTPVI